MFKWLKSALKKWNDKQIRTKGGKIIMSELMWDIIHEGSKETKDIVVSGKDGDKFMHKGKTYTLRLGQYQKLKLIASRPKVHRLAGEG
jgi:hypothetical protein